jgi:hypothetical protein
MLNFSGILLQIPVATSLRASIVFHEHAKQAVSCLNMVEVIDELGSGVVSVCMESYSL